MSIPSNTMPRGPRRPSRGWAFQLAIFLVVALVAPVRGAATDHAAEHRAVARTHASPQSDREVPAQILPRVDPALHAALTGAEPIPAEVLVWFHTPADDLTRPPVSARDPRRQDSHGNTDRQREARRRAIAGERGALRERLRQRGRLPRFGREFQHFAAVTVQIRDREELLELAADPAVRRIEGQLRLVPHATQSLALVGQPTALARGLSGAGSTVVVLDTGVNFTHPAFGCTAPGVPAGCRVRVAQDIAPNDGQLDSNGHGSSVAGIVAAVAPGAGIVALDVFNGNSAAISDVLAGIDWAIQNRNLHEIAAINISIGVPGARHPGDCPTVIDGFTPGGVPLYGFFNPFAEAVAAANAAGISVVTSAGNEGFLDGLPLPACTPGAIAVGAVYDSALGARAWAACTDPVTAADQVTCFSNASGALDLLAPGALITAGGGTWGGTSQAAPHVAAAVTLVRQAHPGETPAQVRDRLVAAGKPLTDPRGIPIRVFPRLDLAASFPLPSNDDFAQATALVGDAAGVNGNNLFATREAGEPLHAGSNGAGSVWFTWTPATSRGFRIRTTGSTFDTLLAVYQGDTVGGLAPLVSDDDSAGGGQSQLLLDAVAGQVYRIAVDGKAGARGSLLLELAPLDSADLAVTLALTPGRVAVGASSQARLSVRNAGPATALNTQLGLTLPAGLTAASPWPAGCTAGGPGLLCNLGALPTGSEWVLDVTLLATAAGTFSPAAQISSATPDLRSQDNQATAPLVAQIAADLGVGLSSLPASIPNGGQFSSSVQLSNAGPGVATGAVLNLQLSGGGGVTTAPVGCTAQGAGRWTCTLGDLAAGASLLQEWALFAFAAGPLSVAATISSGTVDPIPGNDSTSTVGSVVDLPDLALTLAAAAPPPGVAGSGLRAQVMNIGGGAASDIRLRISLPPAVWFSGSNGQCNQAGGLLECRLGALAGESGPAAVVLGVVAGQPGLHTLQGAVSALEADANPANDSAVIGLSVIAGQPPPRQVPALPLWMLAGFGVHLLVRGLLAGLAGIKCDACEH